MVDEANSGQQRDVRARIVSLMRTMGQTRPKEAAQEDAQTLKVAAARLDQMLKEIADTETARCQEEREKTLRAAAGRLDRLLAGIAGKESMPALNLRRSEKDTAVK
jgi:hypothetical protein